MTSWALASRPAQGSGRPTDVTDLNSEYRSAAGSSCLVCIYVISFLAFWLTLAVLLRSVD